jgi:hypothetical protein
MQERVAALGGHAVRKPLGGGFRLLVRLPLAAATISVKELA